jgi:hypothetical protein
MLNLVLFIFLFGINKFMTHVAAHPKMKVEKFLIDVFSVLSVESDVFDFESRCLFFHGNELFLLFWIIFYHY